MVLVHLVDLLSVGLTMETERESKKSHKTFCPQVMTKEQVEEKKEHEVQKEEQVSQKEQMA
jgi:hypothetical protein